MLISNEEIKLINPLDWSWGGYGGYIRADVTHSE